MVSDDFIKKAVARAAKRLEDSSKASEAERKQHCNKCLDKAIGNGTSSELEPILASSKFCPVCGIDRPFDKETKRGALWSTKCRCGSIITIEEAVKEALIKYQTISEPSDSDSPLDSNGEELSLVCDGCYETIEWWDRDDYPDPDSGHTGYYDDLFTNYVKPNSWVKK